MEKENWFQAILAKLLAFVRFIVLIVEDISTFLREGGKGSAFSSRRGIAIAFVVASIYSISLALRSFADLLKYGWVAALVFIPAVVCGVFAIIFSYFASITDFKTAIDAVGNVVHAQGLILPYSVTKGQAIGAEGIKGDLPVGTTISG